MFAKNCPNLDHSIIFWNFFHTFCYIESAQRLGGHTTGQIIEIRKEKFEINENECQDLSNITID